MNQADWKHELHRLLNVIRDESTASLRTIKRLFKASCRPFDEDFRKHFKKVATLRLDTSFDTVLLEGMEESETPLVNDVRGMEIANDSNTENCVDPLDVPNNEDLIEVKLENSVDDVGPEESRNESNDDEQQIRSVNDTNDDLQVDRNVLQQPIQSERNLGGEHDDEGDLNNEIGIERDVKREIKVENEMEIEIGMEDLPLVEFDPIKANETANVEIGMAATAMLNAQGQSSSPPSVHKQLKRDAMKRFKCTECSYASKYKFILNRHLRIHESIKPFKCSHCDYACRRKNDLSRHQKVHVQEKLMGIARNSTDGLYTCTHCDQRFMGIRSLSKHLTQSHKNGQRLFNCSRCMRRFKQETKRDKHEVGCTIRRYECHLCKMYATAHKGNMRKHMQTHSGAKPFDCAICNKHFQRRENLKCHLSSVHGRKHK